MKKKLLYITCDSWWDTDISILDGLSDTFEVDVFVTSLKNRDNNKYPIKNVPDGISLCNEFYETTKWSPFMLFSSLKYLFKLLPYFKNRYVFYVMDGNPYVNFVLPFLLPSKRTIISYHNYVAHSDARFWDKAINNLYLKRFLYFHFQSNIQETYFKSDYPDKKSFSTRMAVKDFGSTSKKTEIYNNEKKIFLFFGYIRDYKRLDLFIKAANKIDGNKAHFVIAGFTKDIEKYIEQIDKIENFSLNFSFIENNSIPDYFTEADFLVLPYSDSSQSGPLLIAYNYHLPVIVSDLEYFKEMVTQGENGYIFEHNNINDLIACINKAISLNDNEYKMMRSRMAFYCEKYKSSSSFSKELNEFINRDLI